MQFEIEVIGHPLTEGEITAYEAGSKIRIPHQYRAFLLEKNGCRPIDIVQPNTGFDADVAEFCALFFRKKSLNNPSVVGHSNDLIWFAVDSGGARFGIAHTGQNYGKVFWFDLPHSEIEEPTSADCELIAQSFEEFLESLRPIT